ncbi:MAG TPA: MoaD/ThiS family protein [Candidatus Acidoferrales bacterium]|nr:MoaD/ThiS family protein [Candidatus Acidoferrales bacterium]
MPNVNVRVRAFARLRELLGEHEFEMQLPQGATLADCWEAVRARNPRIDALASVTRIARNGRVVALLHERVTDGDEIALLPPVGGG